MPIEYNGSDLVFDYLLGPRFDQILLEMLKKAAPYLISCVKVTKETKGQLPEIVEICSYRFRETFQIVFGTLKQLIDLLMSKIFEREEKTRLFSEIYKTFKKSLYA